ncbi:unnamed protein product [Pleuronectes platessa]|uniref:Uncharacterized protein n=1 Tax=Pleuronectes platessa TaxID=8262 RepID=A0A9N7TIR0_PLEPL|nr:unnamed protein product [Pleuronectes platessa]
MLWLQSPGGDDAGGHTPCPAVWRHAVDETCCLDCHSESGLFLHLQPHKSIQLLTQYDPLTLVSMGVHPEDEEFQQMFGHRTQQQSVHILSPTPELHCPSPSQPVGTSLLLRDG